MASTTQSTPSGRATERENLRDEQNHPRLGFFRNGIAKIQSDMETLHTQIEELQQACEAHEMLRSEILVTFTQLRDQIAQLVDQTDQAAQGNAFELNQLQQQLVECLSYGESLEAIRYDLEDQNGLLRARVEKLENLLEDCQGGEADCAAKIKDLEEKCDELQKQVSDRDQKIARRDEALKKQLRTIVELRNELAEASKKQTPSSDPEDRNGRPTQKSQSEEGQRYHVNTQQQKEITQLRNTLSEVRAALQECRDHRKGQATVIEAELKKFEDDRRFLMNENKGLTADLEEAQRQLKECEKHRGQQTRSSEPRQISLVGPTGFHQRNESNLFKRMMKRKLRERVEAAESHNNEDRKKLDTTIQDLQNDLEECRAHGAAARAEIEELRRQLGDLSAPRRRGKRAGGRGGGASWRGRVSPANVQAARAAGPAARGGGRRGRGGRGGLAAAPQPSQVAGRTGPVTRSQTRQALRSS